MSETYIVTLFWLILPAAFVIGVLISVMFDGDNDE